MAGVNTFEVLSPGSEHRAGPGPVRLCALRCCSQRGAGWIRGAGGKPSGRKRRECGRGGDHLDGLCGSRPCGTRSWPSPAATCRRARAASRLPCGGPTWCGTGRPSLFRGRRAACVPTLPSQEASTWRRSWAAGRPTWPPGSEASQGRALRKGDILAAEPVKRRSGLPAGPSRRSGFPVTLALAAAGRLGPAGRSLFRRGQAGLRDGRSSRVSPDSDRTGIRLKGPRGVPHGRPGGIHHLRGNSRPGRSRSQATASPSSFWARPPPEATARSPR